MVAVSSQELYTRQIKFEVSLFALREQRFVEFYMPAWRAYVPAPLRRGCLGGARGGRGCGVGGIWIWGWECAW